MAWGSKTEPADFLVDQFLADRGVRLKVLDEDLASGDMGGEMLTYDTLWTWRDATGKRHSCRVRDLCGPTAFGAAVLWGDGLPNAHHLLAMWDRNTDESYAEWAESAGLCKRAVKRGALRAAWRRMARQTRQFDRFWGPIVAASQDADWAGFWDAVLS